MERGGGNRDTGRSGVPLFVWSGERVDIERRALIDDCELRLEDDGRKLSGVALRFNVRASDRPERFAPGAFDLEGADVILGSGHPASERAIARTGGGLELSADDHALRFRAVLPIRRWRVKRSSWSRRGSSVTCRSSSKRSANG